MARDWRAAAVFVVLPIGTPGAHRPRHGATESTRRSQTADFVQVRGVSLFGDMRE
jgi:hypothetical protein